MRGPAGASHSQTLSAVFERKTSKASEELQWRGREEQRAGKSGEMTALCQLRPGPGRGGTWGGELSRPSTDNLESG